MSMLKIIINKFYNLHKRFERLFSKRSSDAYLSWVKRQGVKIGEGCQVKNPRRIIIDITRPSLLEIGSHVFLHENMSILTHDWTGWTLLPLTGEFIPSHKRTKIGNNIWFGEGVKVLSGVEIGDNCIIGAYSVVTRSIPANSVAVGTPCRVVCSIEQFCEKRKQAYFAEIEDYARSIRERFGREPQLEDFTDDYPIFANGSNCDKYDYPYSIIFNDKEFETWKKDHISKYQGFDDFMTHLNKKV